MLIAQHRRARAVGKAHDARVAIGDDSKSAAFDRMKRKVAHNEALSQAKSELGAEDVDDRFTAIEKADRIEALLAEMKSKQA
jgi:phage shock protein A